MKKIIITLMLSQLPSLADRNIEIMPNLNENPPKKYSNNKHNNKIEAVKEKTSSNVNKILDINAKLKALYERINSKQQKISSLKKTKIQEQHKTKIKTKKSLKRIKTTISSH